MPSAAETIPRCESDRFRLKKRPKKFPLLQLTVQSQSDCKSRKAPVPASTPFTSPLIDPVPLIASRGQVFKGYFINSYPSCARRAPRVFALF
jgi:hypothetical protein